MNRSIVPIIVSACVVILMCCICAFVLASTGLIRSLYNSNLTEISTDEGFIPLPSQTLENVIQVPEPTQTIPLTEKPEPTIPASRPDEVPAEELDDTRSVLENMVVPISDWIELAGRLEGKRNIPVAMDPVTESLELGARETFWVLNSDEDESFQVDTTLRFITDHTYFWIENGVKYRERELRELAETFENEIYPTNREYFGNEWSPGVDGDQHLYILYVTGLGERLAGYFSSADQYHPLVNENSNMHETFVLSADNSDLGRNYTYGVLAHEFQHMIHWYQDRNESSWLNEGFSELAVFINGYDIGGFDALFTENPDLQLNDWPDNNGETAPHYGASFLFLVYFLDRFGPTTTQSLVHHPDNGMPSVDAVLESIDARDLISGQDVRADDVFLDWTLASYINDRDVFDGRYTYHNYRDAPQAIDTEEFNSCPTGPEVRDVSQYGVDYIHFNCAGDYTLKFEGALDVEVVPEGPHSGEYAFWSNKGDDSDMTLTRTFDFRDHTGPLTLTYWTWYDIEKDWDYVYLETSLDGQTWEIITTPSGTSEDPVGNSFGWGYTGLSGSDGVWIKEELDFSGYAGKQVHVRFEYVTDSSVHAEGFLLDDISIPEIGYSTDFETGSDGWEASGFVRIKNQLQQTFRMALIEDGRTTEVTYLYPDADNTLEIPLSFGEGVDDIILVVTGTTRFTRQKAVYQFQMIKN